MKKKIALVAGCSHIAGAEIDGDMDSAYNRTNSFGSLLGKKIGYEPLNIAINGSANTGIARSILRWFDENYDPLSMDVFVVVGWTESLRIEIPAEDRPADYHSGNSDIHWYDSSANSFYRVNFGWEGSSAYEKAMVPKIHQFMAENQLVLGNWAATCILQIQYFLKSINVPYVMCSTMHIFQPREHFTSYLVNLIDETHYHNLRTGQDGSFYWKYRNLGYKNPKAKYWHHDEEPHQLYADELYNFIRENKCLDGLET